MSSNRTGNALGPSVSHTPMHYASANPGLSEALNSFQSSQPGPASPGRADFVQSYFELTEGYEQRFDILHNVIEATCRDLVVRSKVPEIGDIDICETDRNISQFEDGDAKENHDKSGADVFPGNMRRIRADDFEDERLHRSVKRKFVEAMERLQNTHVPKKRRGNLPKEATDFFRKWFEDNCDHPYPSEEQKRMMAYKTGTGVAQITNWFINYRKRVWKPGKHHVDAGHRSYGNT